MTIVDTVETTAPLTAQDVLARARAAVPLLRERSVDIERERCLPADVVELLRSTGAFRVALPKDKGGPELNPMEQTQFIETLATGDISAAWCAMIGMDTPLYARFLGEEVSAELFTDDDTVTAGLILPIGRADRVPGGFKLNGRWGFGSGITHADYVVAGAFVHTDGEPEASPTGQPMHWRILIAKRDQFVVHDTWHTTGLAGSGSRDYEAVDLFVPEAHSFSFATATVSGPNSTPDAILRNMPGVPLGLARAVLDFVRELAVTRTDRMSGVPWSEIYRIQYTIAEAEMELGAVREQVYGSLRTQWELLNAGIELTPDQRVATVLARTNAFRVARSIVIKLADLVATASIYKPSPLDRWLRDAQTMRQHVIAQDQVLQSVGAHLLGGTPSNPFSLGIVQ
ncbi:acyl-CoA dehydrogenase family protein [Actinokineospora terrae]|uniref:Acyl-CoA dehydrogenase n=1 Tax=Actinokineospora terrae TaxID=155974 RepID=A0A1H9WHH4_9PSEU|nr:acyl-CoA dehydrogenase family protein [Actinokineospora terrae]SES33350.1 Acyl-CoA dehydrogenase [Actinokineospora terrae]